LAQKAQNVKDSLERKGFLESTERTRDHHYYFFHRDGKRTQILTKISHGEREISDDNCSNMAYQMKLSMTQFHEFVDCSLTLEKYLNILIQGQYLRQQSQQTTSARSLVVGKGSKREVSAHCSVCKREFSGPRKSGEKETDVLSRLRPEFEKHECPSKSTLTTH
jgi:hypothetical protein